jgi:hypothetical protein
MIVVVTRDVVALQDAAEFRGLTVRVDAAARSDLTELLAEAGVGQLLGNDQVAIREAYLRKAAGPLANDVSWNSGFEAMLEYAHNHGWITAAGEVLAHIEVRG